MVAGVDPLAVKIVIYARADEWYVQPSAESPYTDACSSGEWETETHLGTEYAALLVEPSFKPRSRVSDLPIVQKGVIAVVRGSIGETSMSSRTANLIARPSQQIQEKTKAEGRS